MTVERPTSEPLSLQEVAALATGTRIIVLWSGGNGPHRYFLGRGWGGTLCARDQWEVDNRRWDLTGKALEFVGSERYHTKVWLDEENDGP